MEEQCVICQPDVRDTYAIPGSPVGLMGRIGHADEAWPMRPLSSLFSYVR